MQIAHFIHRETLRCKELAQGHRASEQQGQDLNLGGSDFRAPAVSSSATWRLEKTCLGLSTESCASLKSCV